MSKVNPINGYILVKRVPSDVKSAGGIFLPDCAQEKPQRGKVMALGHGEWCDNERREFSVSVGDSIIFTRYGGSDIKIYNEDYLMITENEILATIKE